MAALLGTTGEGLLVKFGGDAEPQLFGDDGTIVVPVMANTTPIPIIIDSPMPVTVEKPSTSTECTFDIATTPMGNEFKCHQIIGDANGVLQPGNTPTINYKRHFGSSGNVLLYCFC